MIKSLQIRPLIVLVSLFSLFFYQHAFSSNPCFFRVIPLGTSGGEFEDNLSSYLVATKDSNNWVALDAGTLCSSIKNFDFTGVIKQKSTKTQTSLAETFINKNLKALLISHSHLDHISGLVICSTILTNKSVLGIDSTINYLRDFIFNWKIWPNLGDEGIKPWVKNYHYQRLIIGKQVIIPHTNLFVTPFLLNHHLNYPSTAFLIKADQHYLLYLGDTGADSVEHSQDLHFLWEKIAPLIRTHQLHAIFIESSYTNSQKQTELFGHLTPSLLMKELHALANIVDQNNPTTALKGLKIVVTHIKQGFDGQAANTIKKQLKDKNDLGVDVIIPKQNSMFCL